MRLNSKQILQCTGGNYIIRPIDPAEILTGITWDSREVTDGDLYVAIEGEHTDGHLYVKDALKKGARAALVNNAPDASACILARELGAAIIEVPNTLHAIEDIAREWRGHLSAKVIAITGSVGKTTTKTLVRDVCASAFRTIATKGNQNNELGVPNTILSADPDTQVLVVEMGMRGLGQIRHLCNIARPDWGIITNVGESHMELLGSKENIARAKSELFCALPDGTGIAFVNSDDDNISKMPVSANFEQRGIKEVHFGRDAQDCTGSKVWPEDVEVDREGRADFTLCAQGFEPASIEPTLFNIDPDAKRANCHLSVRGEHNVINACAACAVGLSLGIPIEKIAGALERSVGEAGRLETHDARDGFLVIDDSYNANPDSMRAALVMLSSMNISGKRVAVLGDMAELGDGEVACHEGVGRLAADLHSKGQLDCLICIGELSEHMAQSATDAGMEGESLVHASSIGEALERLEGSLGEGDAVLVKASNFMHLDRIVEGLIS